MADVEYQLYQLVEQSRNGHVAFASLICAHQPIVHGDGHNYAEATRIIGCSENTVSSLFASPLTVGDLQK